jgi:predicted amidohydrolase
MGRAESVMRDPALWSTARITHHAPRMKLYCVQHDIAWENKRANFVRVEALLAAARPEAGSLVLLPEMFATGFSMNAPAIGEAPGGETEKFLSATAKRFNVFLLGGAAILAGAKSQNQCVVFSPDGAEFARYAKMQPFTLGGESANYQAGKQVVVFPWQGFVVAPFICYDLRFPEHFRAATKLGAQLIAVIANWPVRRIGHWVALLQARAIENQAYVAGVNRCGADPSLTYNGRSLIVSPKGDILADAGNGESVISAEVNLQELLDYRRELPFLADMRPL